MALTVLTIASCPLGERLVSVRAEGAHTNGGGS